MKKLVSVAGAVVFLAFIMSTDSLGEMRWAIKGPAEGKIIKCLAMDPQNPQILYAGGVAGVFKTTNGGGNWAPVNTGLTSAEVLALAIDPQNPQTLYAGTYGEGVFKTTNGGGNWAPANTGLTVPYILGLAMDPQNHLYAGTFNPGRVFKSIDGGDNWALADIGLAPVIGVIALAIDPQNSQTLYAGTDYESLRLFKSTNGGGDWEAANVGLAVTGVAALAIDPQNSQTLYAGGNGLGGGGVFKSTNGGDSWAAVKTGIDVLSLAIDPQNPQTLYAGTAGNGFFRSTTGGDSWADFSIGLTFDTSSVDALAIDPQAPQTVYGGTQGGGVIKTVPMFEDVPPEYWAFPSINLLYDAGITGGCSLNPFLFCPGNIITRGQMAVFTEASLGVKSIPPCTGTVFNDVNAGTVGAAFCGYIEDFYARGITGGCGGGNYCPYNPVTRAQMAVFIEAALGVTTIPPCTGTDFNDVNAGTVGSAFCGFIEDFANRGITAGCGGGNFCPSSPVTRAQMAVFLVAAPPPLSP